MSSRNKAYYVGTLRATDYWPRWEWQHRGSPHLHRVAWFLMHQTLTNFYSEIQNADTLVSTINPGVLLDGSYMNDAPLAHVTDFCEDLKDLV